MVLYGVKWKSSFKNPSIIKNAIMSSALSLSIPTAVASFILRFVAPFPSQQSTSLAPVNLWSILVAFTYRCNICSPSLDKETDLELGLYLHVSQVFWQSASSHLSSKCSAIMLRRHLVVSRQ